MLTVTIAEHPLASTAIVPAYAEMDLLPYIQKLSIVDKDTARILPLSDAIRWPQRHLINHTSRQLSRGKSTRVIVLKARQLGISTIVEGIQFTLAMLNDNFRGQVVSHETKSNEHLLSMTQTYYDTFPYRRFYEQRNKAANKLSWEPTGSRIGVSTAKNLGSGRGQTIHFLHGSEVAFWPDAATLMAGLGQAIPKSAFSFIYLESTANGIGNWFCTTWDEAVAGRNDYTPMFFPWQTHPEYVGTHIGIDPVDPLTMDDQEQELAAFFANDRLGEENAQVLARSMQPDELAALRGPISRDEILSRLAWRRYIIRNDLRGSTDLFLQEYPHTPSVAFLSTGRNIFPLPHLEPIYKPMTPLTGELVSSTGRLRFHEAPQGALRVYSPPRPGRSYVIGGDPTFTMAGDYGCAQVLDRQTWEQVAVWRGKKFPGPFGETMVRLGYWYNEALLVPETNRDGATTMGVIQGYDYPNIWERQVVDTQGDAPTNKLGWHTNARTKAEAIGNLQSCIYDKSVTVHDTHTFTELKNYVDLGLGHYGNANGSENDDTVMALALAASVNMYEQYQFNHPVPDYAANTEALRTDVNAAMQQLGSWQNIGPRDVGLTADFDSNDGFTKGEGPDDW